MKLLGHAALHHRLFDLLTTNRLPGGLLLTGPKGVGKYTLAKAFATSLLIGDTPESSFDVNDSHPVARRIASGGHGDILIVQKGVTTEGKLNRDISVEDARKVINFMHKTPLEGGWRIVIVDSIDDLNRNAANALLKILEEPSSHAILLLISHAPGKVLPTIRSRCQEMKFSPLSEIDMRAYLKPHGLEDSEVTEIIALSEGRPGYALQLIESTGLAIYKDLLQALTLSPQRGVSAYFPLIEKYSSVSTKETSPDLFEALGNLTQTCLARLITWSVLPSQESILGENEAFRSALTKHPAKRWVEIWQKSTVDLNQAHRFSLNRKQVLAGLFEHFA